MRQNGRNVALLAAAMLMSVALGPLNAWSDDTLVRSTDGQVKNIIKAIADSERRFEKALDGKIKSSVLRGANDEIDVKRYLQDLRQDINVVAQRFTDKYAASTEVRNLLERAAVMHAYLRQNPQTKGASEWDMLAGYLGNLATAYGSTFPLGQGAAVRRVGDREVLTVVDELDKQTGPVDSALKKAARNDKSLASVASTGSNELDTLSAALKAFKSRLKAEKVATAEARQVLVVGDRIAALLSNPAVPDSVRTAWSPANQQLDVIAQAFGMQRAVAPESLPPVEHAEPPAQPGEVSAPVAA